MKLILTKTTLTKLIEMENNGDESAIERLNYFETFNVEDKGFYLLLTQKETTDAEN